jgi:hypothetical protein
MQMADGRWRMADGEHRFCHPPSAICHPLGHPHDERQIARLTNTSAAV